MLGRRPPQPSRAARVAQRAKRMVAMVASVKPRASVVGGSTTAPAPKTEAYRDQALLDMARGRPCLFMVPAVCNYRLDTTVVCHSNMGIHGKAGARKADDQYSAYGCSACHYWYDFGKARSQDKEAAFMAAHARQVLAWRLIAMDPQEPPRFRRAAARALQQLGATPLPHETETTEAP